MLQCKNKNTDQSTTGRYISTTIVKKREKKKKKQGGGEALALNWEIYILTYRCSSVGGGQHASHFSQEKSHQLPFGK